MSIPDMETNIMDIPEELAVIPLRDLVVFPYMIFPLFIGRPGTIQAVDQTLSDETGHKFVLLLSQRDAGVEEPGPDDMYQVGTVATIMRMLKLPDGKVKVLVQGVARARVSEFESLKPFIKAKIEKISPEEEDDEGATMETEALVKNVREQLERANTLGKQFPAEIMLFINNIDEPGRLADIVMAHLDADLQTSQGVLETTDASQRLLKVLEALTRETQMLDLQHQILSQAKGEMDKSQREYLLRQQLKAIQEELGEGDDLRREIDEMREKLEKARMPKDVAETCAKQIRRLEGMHPDSAEAGVVRTYLDWLLTLPWQKSSRERLELSEAHQILEDDHYGLVKVKERILEYLAVRKLNKQHKGPILCFVGPPGVGKTSLGRSIARALKRKFVRVSLGGVRDEAEIRGHRRTYVGALPGRIVQSIRQAGTNNPVFMLDEVDKLGADFRGDPSAALLEVLDPEQNVDFRDHYLEVPFDLSKVLFIATANSLDPIHPAFLDRMEVISIAGYTMEEKEAISRRFLLPKQLKENGISEKFLDLSDEGLDQIIAGYTREAGLRNLERRIGALCRKVARRVAEGNKDKVTISPDGLREYLGAPVFLEEEAVAKDEVGVVRGLAVTGAGGDVLNVEATTMPGKGNLILTGSLGDVMKESARAALSFIRHRSASLEIPPEVFESTDIHVHVPEGATPKDGPSAGITIATAMLSRYLGKPAGHTIAMTGEITLTGRVLRIGGVKEKFLAAKRFGATRVIMPKANHADYDELQEDYKTGVEAFFAETMDEVIELVFGLKVRKTKSSEKLAPLYE